MGLGEGSQNRPCRYTAADDFEPVYVIEHVPVLAGWESIKQYVYAAPHTYDTFFHAWVETSKREQELCCLLKPTAYITERQSIPTKIKHRGKKVLNKDKLYSIGTTHQLISRSESVKLALDWSQKKKINYDLLVVLRFDLLFTKFVDYKVLNDDILYWSGGLKRKLGLKGKFGKIYDFFWVGSPDVMRKTLLIMRPPGPGHELQRWLAGNPSPHKYYGKFLKGHKHQSILYRDEEWRLCRDILPQNRLDPFNITTTWLSLTRKYDYYSINQLTPEQPKKKLDQRRKKTPQIMGERP